MQPPAPPGPPLLLPDDNGRSLPRLLRLFLVIRDARNPSFSWRRSLVSVDARWIDALSFLTILSLEPFTVCCSNRSTRLQSLGERLDKSLLLLFGSGVV
jgi:hypothetical protein